MEGALDAEASRAFFAAFLPFQERIARLGVQNSLVQTALKLTLPGVPDIYQGADLWDLSLVDPDNRRPVDYERRVRLLGEFARLCPGQGSGPVQQFLAHWQDGAVKLFMTSRLLGVRAARPELFGRGEYEPLYASGPSADLICAFTRRLEENAVLVITARFPAHREAEPEWGATLQLPQYLCVNTLKNVLTGADLLSSDGVVDVAPALEGLPVGVFSSGI